MYFVAYCIILYSISMHFILFERVLLVYLSNSLLLHDTVLTATKDGGKSFLFVLTDNYLAVLLINFDRITYSCVQHFTLPIEFCYD